MSIKFKELPKPGSGHYGYRWSGHYGHKWWKIKIKRNVFEILNVLKLNYKDEIKLITLKFKTKTLKNDNHGTVITKYYI